ncbi:MAG: hypothetical protein AVDCRST_MAG50-1753 [uncultured Acidimicrobiales bacterium]|uniref:Cytochrome c oxidase polypeptide IV n=1 Tax=uncultured Acidimicrobiales bacterium TaxID=310071 RepID=A0A6J4I779_9ACTN|nr:MAG: hypothetical protein AVDCRST_MAG50-1753 [uncultured Acidimicrobiales bacterium]
MAVDTEQHGSHTQLPEGGEHAEHPSDRQYIVVALGLAVLTAIEVALYYFEFDNVNVNNGVLGVLALIKFVVVIAYFMHLRFDNRVLRRFFVAGFLLAIFVYIATLSTFHVFTRPPGSQGPDGFGDGAPSQPASRE